MTNAVFAAHVQETIRAKRLDGLPAEFIIPNYEGYSVANIGPTVAQLLGGQIPGGVAMPDAAWADLAAGVQRVVLIVLDAVGYAQLARLLDTDADLGILRRLSQAGRLFPLTSVFPSTTTAVLTSLWTGRTPAEHGLIGYVLFLRELGVTADMIRLVPRGRDKDGCGRDTLLDWGLSPEDFLAVPGLAQTLADDGIVTRSVIRKEYLGGFLSRLHYRGVTEMSGHLDAADMWVCLREMLQAHRDERLYLSAYWGAVDTISHERGPYSPHWDAALRNLTYSLEREFLAPLSPADRQGTLLLITADHGQIVTPLERTIYLQQHPALLDALVMSPTGEPRVPYLYVRPGRVAEVKDYFAEHLAHAFVTLDADTVISSGLLGHEPVMPAVPYRLGDVVAIARDDWILYDRPKEPDMIGRHGGLTPGEMLVPMLMARLDAEGLW
ncbi:MAG: alkaline phosphatase family protein [Chloroflexi bacterium]|nr:alkaline phosphatase family protein [Chloroflexota bacterium]MBU1746612.1 alkaline phosphatase family protein [Chloroflexota bacterium]MBU1879232.1 alkaline phosphatase family protein [Chloroflexota bacterium]